jgi:hypothetical protein
MKLYNIIAILIIVLLLFLCKPENEKFSLDEYNYLTCDPENINKCTLTGPLIFNSNESAFLVCNKSGCKSHSFNNANNVTINGGTDSIIYVNRKVSKSSDVTSTQQTSYAPYNFVQYTVLESDLPEQPITGTLQECQNACEKDNACIGFSRSHKSEPNLKSQCWLKKSYPNPSLNDNFYRTYVKPNTNIPSGAIKL